MCAGVYSSAKSDSENASFGYSTPLSTPPSTPRSLTPRCEEVIVPSFLVDEPTNQLLKEVVGQILRGNFWNAPFYDTGDNIRSFVQEVLAQYPQSTMLITQALHQRTVNEKVLGEGFEWMLAIVQSGLQLDPNCFVYFMKRVQTLSLHLENPQKFKAMKNYFQEKLRTAFNVSSLKKQEHIARLCWQENNDMWSMLSRHSYMSRIYPMDEQEALPAYIKKIDVALTRSDILGVTFLLKRGIMFFDLVTGISSFLLPQQSYTSWLSSQIANL